MSKMIAVTDLVPGKVLADAVLSGAGKVLLGKSVELTARHISLLNNWEIQNVFIESDGNDTDPIPTAVEKTEEVTTGSAKYEEFSEAYDAIVSSVTNSFDLIRQSKIIPVTHFKDTAGEIKSSIEANNFEIMNYLLAGNYKIKDVISRHSVMVAYMAGVIARQMKWSEQDIEGVALAGLMHDIGNLVANRDVMSYQQAHIAETAGLLKNARGIPAEVILGIVQHREYADGTGVPTGSKAGQIHPYARVIAVADSFHNQAYTEEYANPFPSLDMLTREMYGKFDADVCQKFISRLKDSLILNRILLSDGEEAEIIFFNRDSYEIPVVKTKENQIIDLAKRKDLSIAKIVIPK